MKTRQQDSHQETSPETIRHTVTIKASTKNPSSCLRQMDVSPSPRSCCARFLHTFKCRCSYFTEILCPSTHAIRPGAHIMQPQSDLACPRCVFSGLLSDVRQVQIAVQALRHSTDPSTVTAFTYLSSDLKNPALALEDQYPEMPGQVLGQIADGLATTDAPHPSVAAQPASVAEAPDSQSIVQHRGLTKVILLYSTLADRFRRTHALYFPDVPLARYKPYTSSPGHLAAILERIVRVLEEPVGYSLGKDVAGNFELGVDAKWVEVERDGSGARVLRKLDPLFVVVREGGADEEAMVVAESAVEEEEDGDDDEREHEEALYWADVHANWRPPPF